MRIAIYPAIGGKPFTGDTLEQEALGGSETAVIEVARGLARKGHEVLVFAKGKPGVYDDVYYLPWDKARNILRTTPVEALICSRDPTPLLWRHRAPMTFLWHHDLPQLKGPEPTFHVFVSRWQAALYVTNDFAKQERALIIPNGIDISLFQHQSLITDIDRADIVRFAWTSNPERGLWYAGEVLQRVRMVYPNAYLHVYGRNAVYGWDGGCEGNFLPSDMDNVVLHDALDKRSLAQALAETDVWVYPTWWPETYCIAAVEAQAAGVPVVCSDYGALVETAETQRRVPESASKPGHIENVTAEVLSLLANKQERLALAEKGRAYAQTQTWEAAVNTWDNVLSSVLEKVL